jgi:lipopolysaccharide export system protein LptA
MGNNKSSYYTYIFLLIFIVCLIVCSAFAEAAEWKEASRVVPTGIRADRMEYNANGQLVVFNGNVYVKRPDFELRAAKVTIYLERTSIKNDSSPSKTAQSMQPGDIKSIVAEKSVRITSNDKEGSCQKATYYVKTDKFVMEGNPLLKDKDRSSIAGTVIVHFFKANRSEVQNPQATFFTQEAVDNSLMPGGRIKEMDNE